MTVAELIEKLKTMPQEIPVKLECGDYWEPATDIINISNDFVLINT